MMRLRRSCALHDLEGHLAPLYFCHLLQKLSPFFIFALGVQGAGHYLLCCLRLQRHIEIIYFI